MLFLSHKIGWRGNRIVFPVEMGVAIFSLEVFRKDPRYKALVTTHAHPIGLYIEENQLVIFYMKNISRGCVVKHPSEIFFIPEITS